MSRLCDRLLRVGPVGFKGDDLALDFARTDHERLSHGRPVVLANNVTEYLYANSEQGYWEYGKDIPNLAPIFSEFFIETRKPSAVRCKGGMSAWPDAAPHAWGLFVKADDYKAEVGDGWQEHSVRSLNYTTSRMNDQDGKPYFSGRIEEPVRWLVHSHFYYELPNDKGPVGPAMVQFMALKEDGTPVRNSAGEQVIWAMPCAKGSRVSMQFYAEECGKMVWPLWLAISFANCRNVQLDEHEPPQKLSRKHRKRHGRPLTRYHTIEIEPMTAALEREGNVSGNGLKAALHICRGHFKTYTEDKPLFGKRTGTYWWPQTVRGSKQSGEVVKDYSVKAPGGSGG